MPGAVEGARYKYEIKGPKGEILPLKSDPVGFEAEFRPGTASIIGRIGDRLWRDWEWISIAAVSFSRSERRFRSTKSISDPGVATANGG